MGNLEQENDIPAIEGVEQGQSKEPVQYRQVVEAMVHELWDEELHTQADSMRREMKQQLTASGQLNLYQDLLTQTNGEAGNLVFLILDRWNRWDSRNYFENRHQIRRAIILASILTQQETDVPSPEQEEFEGITDPAEYAL